MVREAGLEPARPEWTLEPESSESANSTTRAFGSFVIIAPPPPLVKKKICSRRLFPKVPFRLCPELSLYIPGRGVI